MFSSFNMFATLSPQVELRIWQKYRLQHCAMKCIEPAVNHPVYVIYHISWFHFWFSIIYWDEIQLASLCENSLLYFLNVDSFLRHPAPLSYLRIWHKHGWVRTWKNYGLSLAHVSALQRIFQRFMHQHSVPPAKNGYGYWSWNTMIWRVKISKFYFPVACKVQNTSIQKLKPKQMMYHPFYKIKFPKA